MIGEKDLMIPRNTAQLVAAYQSASLKIKQGYALLEAARQELNVAFGQPHYYSSFTVLDRHGSGDPATAEGEIQDVLKRDIWRQLIRRLGIEKVLSVKRAEEFQKNLDNGKIEDIPDITDEMVIQVFTEMMGQAKSFAEEAVVEVYDFLMPAGRFVRNQYVTNHKNGRGHLGKKVILQGIVEHRSGGGFEVRNWYSFKAQDNLIATDRIFHLLDGEVFDGKGYRSPLVDAINTTGPDGLGETDYFKFRCCANGNLHLEFKRPDLVTELNRVAGRAEWLPEKAI